MSDILSFLEKAPQYIVPFLVILSVVVFVHEFGHYWVAKLCGVKIDAFSIGFGREIKGWTDKSGTRWKLCWLPLGGYVKMFGDADATSSRADEKIDEFSAEEKNQTFYHKNVWQRFAIVAAGPCFNYIFAIIVFAILFMVSGQPFTPPVVNAVVENSAAAKAGLQLGDKIIAIDGKPVERFEDIKRIVSMNVGSSLAVDYVRNGQPMNLSVTPDVVLTKDRFGGEHRMGRLGVASQDVAYVELGPWESLHQSVAETWNMTAATLKAVGQMIIGVRGTEDLGGPLRIAQMSGKVATEGFSAIIWFMAIISVNLGLINFFPIPLLDGGNLAFYIAEILRRKPLSDSAQEVGARIGVVLIFSLMVFATWNDLVQLRVISYLQGLFS
jgi:regulator of sigma E protease